MASVTMNCLGFYFYLFTNSVSLDSTTYNFPKDGLLLPLCFGIFFFPYLKKSHSLYSFNSWLHRGNYNTIPGNDVLLGDKTVNKGKSFPDNDKLSQFMVDCSVYSIRLLVLKPGQSSAKIGQLGILFKKLIKYMLLQFLCLPSFYVFCFLLCYSSLWTLQLF